MSLARFSLIVAVDGGNGIAKEGQIPWTSSADRKFFRETTMGKGRNVVIMGRVTYEAIPPEFRPLEGRTCIVISRIWKAEEHPDCVVCPSIAEALKYVGMTMKKFDDIFVYGGEQIYSQIISDYLYLCDRIYVTKYKKNYDCDQYFPFDDISHFRKIGEPILTKDYSRFTFEPGIRHNEYSYLDAMERILDEGETKTDRTGTGTLSVFGDINLKFDISERIPILTTKKIKYDNIIKELLFFISGKTNTKILESQDVNIWKDNTSRAFLDDLGLDYEEGVMGPMYPHQWRHAGHEYTGYDDDSNNQGIDQLKEMINEIRSQPHSRRLLVNTWSVPDLKKMVLPPCHFAFQFNVSADHKFLDCKVYQRSGDMFLGIPYNIASYAMLTYMVAHITGKKPRNLYFTIGDAHIYSNLVSQTRRQLSRTPFPFPKLSFRRGMKLKEIDDFTFDSFVIQDYKSHEYIGGKMAV